MSQGEEFFGTIYKKGEVVFRQGDSGETMYIIQSGAVEVSQRQGDKEVVLAILEQGDFFGEMALVDEKPRSATVTAIHRTRLLPLTRTSVMERMRHDPGVVLHLVKALSQRIVQTKRLLRLMVESNEALRSALASTREDVVPEEFIPQPIRIRIDRDECVWFEPGQTVFRLADPGDTMYIIAEGAVEISEEFEEDRYVLARLGPYEFFGEIALITSCPRTATASAIKHTLLLPIKREEFLDLVKVQPELALYILQVLIIRLRATLAALETPGKSLNMICRTLPPLLNKERKVRVAIISLSTCGGCPGVLLQQREELAQLMESIRVSYCPMLMDESQMGQVEVAIVDGVVRVKEDEEKLKEARLKSRYLVAWGTCATFGGIPAMANQYELEDLIEESYGQTFDPISYYLSGRRGIEKDVYQYSGIEMFRRAGKLNDFVRVDYYLPGCPPLVSLLTQLIKEFKGEQQTLERRQIVCAECPRKPVKRSVEHFWALPKQEWEPNYCFISGGALCMGFLTRGGCGAVCPRGGLPCWGCRGPSNMALKKIAQGYNFEEFLVNSLVRRFRLPQEKIKPGIRMVRHKGISSLNFDQNFVNDPSNLR